MASKSGKAHGSKKHSQLKHLTHSQKKAHVGGGGGLAAYTLAMQRAKKARGDK